VKLGNIVSLQLSRPDYSFPCLVQRPDLGIPASIQFSESLFGLLDASDRSCSHTGNPRQLIARTHKVQVQLVSPLSIFLSRCTASNHAFVQLLIDLTHDDIQRAHCSFDFVLIRAAACPIISLTLSTDGICRCDACKVDAGTRNAKLFGCCRRSARFRC
jgi:hypothetical protein